jgi:hypothetical protein
MWMVVVLYLVKCCSSWSGFNERTIPFGPPFFMVGSLGKQSKAIADVVHELLSKTPEVATQILLVPWSTLIYNLRWYVQTVHDDDDEDFEEFQTQLAFVS